LPTPRSYSDYQQLSVFCVAMQPTFAVGYSFELPIVELLVGALVLPLCLFVLAPKSKPHDEVKDKNAACGSAAPRTKRDAPPAGIATVLAKAQGSGGKLLILAGGCLACVTLALLTFWGLLAEGIETLGGLEALIVVIFVPIFLVASKKKGVQQKPTLSLKQKEPAGNGQRSDAEDHSALPVAVDQGSCSGTTGSEKNVLDDGDAEVRGEAVDSEIPPAAGGNVASADEDKNKDEPVDEQVEQVQEAVPLEDHSSGVAKECQKRPAAGRFARVFSDSDDETAIKDHDADDDDDDDACDDAAGSKKVVWADEDEDDEVFWRKVEKERVVQREHSAELAMQAAEAQAAEAAAQDSFADEDMVPDLTSQYPHKGGGKGKGSKGQAKGGKGKGRGKPGHGAGSPDASGDAISQIRSLGRAGDIAGARDIFEKALETGAAPTMQLQNALLAALVQGEDINAAAELFEQMKGSSQVDVVSFNIMLRASSARGMRSEVDNLLKEMTELGVAANKITFNELLGDRVRAGDRCGMWRVVDDIKAAGIGIGRIACSILLKALDSSTPPADVKRTLELLKELDEPGDEVLCSSAIEACLRVKEFGLLSDIMDRLGRGEMCSSCGPLSSATYGSMIKAYGQAGDLDRVWGTWRHMLQQGISAKVVTVGCLIEALVANGAVEDAWNLVNEAQFDNCVLYSTVLKGFARRQEPDRCFEVFEQMRSRGVERNSITYNTLLDACVKCGVMEKVPEVFEEMKSSRVRPDVITYSTLVKGFCLAGDLDRAFGLLSEMRQDENGVVEPDEIVYNSLLDGCARQHETDRALKVLEDMKASGVAPSNYTLSILVKLMGRSHRLKRAFTMVEELRAAYGLRPNIQVYTCLMQACLQNKQVGRALEVHDEMVRELQAPPDQKAFNVLLGGCIKAWAMEEAVRVARCAYGLPGHGLAEPQDGWGASPGVDQKLLAELAMKLRSARAEEKVVQDFEEVQALAATRPNLGSSWNSRGFKGDGKGEGKGGGKGGKGGYHNGKGGGKNGKGSYKGAGGGHSGTKGGGKSAKNACEDGSEGGSAGTKGW